MEAAPEGSGLLTSHPSSYPPVPTSAASGTSSAWACSISCFTMAESFCVSSGRFENQLVVHLQQHRALVFLLAQPPVKVLLGVDERAVRNRPFRCTRTNDSPHRPYLFAILEQMPKRTFLGEMELMVLL